LAVTVAFQGSGITKRFGRTVAVADASLEVERGEAVGLVGPNGSGKTTFLRCDSGLLKMDEGRASIGGHDVNSDHAAAMESLAFVPELPAPFGTLSPWEHLLFTARAFSLAPNWERRAEQLLRDLDLEGNSRKLSDELSKGQKQKVHIATAMLRNPPFVVLDEPLIGIDPKGVHLIKEWIKSRVAAGGAFLLSSHTLPFVEELCHRVAIISSGRIVAVGTLEELRTRSRTADAASLEDVFLRLTGSEDSGVLRG
jgi:ABC-2 type transport system ATP-binding protein